MLQVRSLWIHCTICSSDNGKYQLYQLKTNPQPQLCCRSGHCGYIVPLIDNLDFKDDPEIYVFSKLKYVVIELWQVCVYHQQSLSLDVSGKGDMAVPVIDFSELHGENRSKTMNLLHQACEKWGCFQILISKHLLYEDGVLLQLCDAGHRHVPLS
ncbi:hypothetical protein ACFE04_031104 [Oxalis oulophora]